MKYQLPTSVLFCHSHLDAELCGIRATEMAWKLT